MKLSKRTISLFLALSMLFMLTGCKESNTTEYTMVQSFEYHFYPEEYEEKYNEFNKSYTLASDKDYQVKLSATCEDGTMEILITDGENEQRYKVSPSDPCNEIISVTANSSSTMSFTVIIEEETNGSVIGEILSR